LHNIFFIILMPFASSIIAAARLRRAPILLSRRRFGFSSDEGHCRLPAAFTLFITPASRRRFSAAFITVFAEFHDTLSVYFAIDYASLAFILYPLLPLPRCRLPLTPDSDRRKMRGAARRQAGARG